MSTHNIGFYEDLTKIIFEVSSNITKYAPYFEAILMSTHNIGFYEDLTKIIFELSSNIIKYAPYFFCCASHTQNVTPHDKTKTNVCQVPNQILPGIPTIVGILIFMSKINFILS